MKKHDMIRINEEISVLATMHKVLTRFFSLNAPVVFMQKPHEYVCRYNFFAKTGRKRRSKIGSDYVVHRCLLLGQQLRSIVRGGASIFIGFGELIESDVLYRDENGQLARNEKGKLAKRKGFVSRYALHAECSMRLSCDDEILFAKSDIFLPKSSLVGPEPFDWDSFEWDIVGNNYFDEMVGKYIGDDPFEFIVEKINVNKFGDVKISFKNKFVLELFADGSGESGNWRFFEMGNKERHLVVTGNGIERYEEDICNDGTP